MNPVAALGAAPAHGYSATIKASFAFVAVAVVCLAFADISVTTLDPWG